MNLFQISLTLVLSFILAIYLFFLEFPLLIIVSTTFIFFLAIYVLPQIFLTHRSNNLDFIERFLRSNKKKPLFAYPLALANGTPKEVEESLRAILAKHKQPYMQNVYKTILALHLKNIDAADTYAQKIDSEPLKSYYAAYIAAKRGDFEEAARHEKNIGVDWMIHSLHAIYAQEKGQYDDLVNESRGAISLSRGVQKFISLHSFKEI
jgi:hypothetical protein